MHSSALIAVTAAGLLSAGSVAAQACAGQWGQCERGLQAVLLRVADQRATLTQAEVLATLDPPAALLAGPARSRISTTASVCRVLLLLLLRVPRPPVLRAQELPCHLASQQRPPPAARPPLRHQPTPLLRPHRLASSEVSTWLDSILE